MGNLWFRLYHEWDSDPKVQSMTEMMQRRLVMLFCSRCREEKISDTDRAFHWRISPAELQETKLLFIEKGFIDEHWNILNWNRRQFLSDSSTDRVRRHRENRGLKQDETLQKRDVTFHNVSVKQSVTAPDTDTDTDTEAEQKKPTPKASPSSFSLPIWIHPDTWKAFEENRRKLRAPMTDRARQNIIAELVRLKERGCDPEQVLNRSITNGWKGVFELNGNGANGHGKLDKFAQMRRDDDELFGPAQDSRGVN